MAGNTWKRDKIFAHSGLNKQTRIDITISHMNTNIIEIYCAADEFSKKFDEGNGWRLLTADSGKCIRNCQFVMSDAEIMTAVILFHLKYFRNLKAFYTLYIQLHE
jgi:hypothetical protein